MLTVAEMRKVLDALAGVPRIVAMLLYGALTGANPVVDGFHPFDVSISNFTAVLANENRVGEAERADAACDLGDLRFAVGACVPRRRDQPIDRPELE